MNMMKKLTASSTQETQMPVRPCAPTTAPPVPRYGKQADDAEIGQRLTEHLPVMGVKIDAQASVPLRILPMHMVLA